MSSSVSSSLPSLVSCIQHQYILYDAAVGASLLLIFKVVVRMSNCWIVRCNGKGVLPYQNGSETISSEVFFAVNCSSLLA